MLVDTGCSRSIAHAHEEDEEIDDIGELPADFDFTGFEDVLTDLREPGPDCGKNKEGASVHTYASVA